LAPYKTPFVSYYTLDGMNPIAEEPGEPPTLGQFLTACRDALDYLEDYGFAEVTPPAHRRNNDFQVWFQADNRIVIATGESYGTAASITLEHTSGVELSEIFLVPREHRPKRSNKPHMLSQLAQLREAAVRLKKYGQDFLSGDLTRFFEHAKPLPPYKRAGSAV
jgi:hypothetical protein